MVQAIVFIIIFISAFSFFTYKILKVRRNILLGRDIDLSDQKGKRFWTMTRVAFGQSKMTARPTPFLMHLFIYVAFLITQIELIEIIIDGATDHHRTIWHWTEGTFFSYIYVFTINFIEILSVLAFVATIVFLSRRNLLKLPRFHKPEMKGWPFKDANLILMGEITLVTCIMLMNSADVALQGRVESFQYAGPFYISGVIAKLWSGLSIDALMMMERIGWWGHILGILGFMVYLPFSKHFHIFLAFPNTYFTYLKPKGQLTNLASVTAEVKLMLDPNADPLAVPAPDPNAPPVKFGAKDVHDLHWKNLMDAYSCTECGRCTAECPANITGKKLSPRKIMMDTRDRLEEVGRNLDKKGKDFNDGKTLLGNYITEEELWACTSCNACVQACPVNINPLEIIIELRRDLIMEQSKAPAPINTMLNNIQNNGAPWQFSPMDRANWANEMNT